MITDQLKNAFRFHRQQFDARMLAGATPLPSRMQRVLTAAILDVLAGKTRYPGPAKPYPVATRQSDPDLWGFTNDDCSGALRFVCKVDAEGRETRRDDLGWLTDPHGDVFKDGTGICQGVVWQLAGRDGQARYVAGYQFGGVDGGPTLDLKNIHDAPGDCAVDAKRDACLAANEHARIAGEKEREYQTAWQAGARFAQLGEEANGTRAEIVAMLGEFRRARKSLAGFEFETLCRTVRAVVSDKLASLYALRKGQDALLDGEDNEGGELSWWRGDKRLVEAFNEGAGI